MAVFSAMKSLFVKSGVTLLLTGLTPALLFLAITSPLLLMAWSGSRSLNAVPGFFQGTFITVLAFALIAFLVSLAHVTVLGIPALVIGWRYKIINWWSVLITSFIIGGMPTAIGAFILIFQGPNGFPSAPGMGTFLGVGLALALGIVMGLFGVSGGIVFWILWRRWVSRSMQQSPPLPPEAKGGISSMNAI